MAAVATTLSISRINSINIEQKQQHWQWLQDIKNSNKNNITASAASSGKVASPINKVIINKSAKANSKVTPAINKSAV